ncbi:MAG: hypothetical protein JRG86_14045 [Deltaproteobacteria bacterium]|jgi:hypothetical protein|nr:hypothetical protein [Deltaproteobacteria bacterium]MBW2500258.1 hypothetical protein [Deltaproteobacteria bacterium]
MEAYATGVLVVVGLALGWLAVQRAWARSFPDAFEDPDVLAGRRGCEGCGCATPCGSSASPDRTAGAQERGL